MGFEILYFLKVFIFVFPVTMCHDRDTITPVIYNQTKKQHEQDRLVNGESDISLNLKKNFSPMIEVAKI